MKNIIYISILLLVMCMSACGPSQSELAAESYKSANIFLSKQDTTSAIETINIALKKYSDAEKMVGKLKELKGNIYTDICNQLNHSLDSCDMIIRQKMKDFVVEERPFDKKKWYVYKRQTFKRSWDRSFLEVNLNEIGNIYITSNYIGDKSLNHTAVRVYDKELSCKTPKVDLDRIENHHSDFMDSKWEKVSYKNGASDELIKFIASHPGRSLKAVFLGNRYYYILLEKYDIEAVVKSYELSLILKKREQFKKRLHNVDKRICTDC
ncbi:hypothetical protein K4L44_12120 [Halosquirtibacter laminarini]|uniref:Uncharacterized protein n=1 Tax=Halosquirtibacter laminarini TaxID=3374600 RepID=A0AC61NCT6_9BACT|nr:hypothetical protein K4L44_12120 [Prolixibacteraceae bacterium]